MSVDDGDGAAAPGKRETGAGPPPRGQATSGSQPALGGKPTPGRPAPVRRTAASSQRTPSELRATLGRAAFGRWPEILGSATILLLASFLSAGIAFGAKEACRAGAWNVGVEQYQAHCYTDIYPLYYGEGLSAHQIPYLHHHVEYPVIIGAVMQGASWLVQQLSSQYANGVQFFDINVAFLAIFLVSGVLATAYCAGPARRWTALLVAFSPALILSAFINWDLIAMALSLAALAAWAARRPVLAGVLLGLAVATKFYPIVMLWPLLLLCIRAGRLRAFAVTTGSAAGAWLVVNLPVAIAAPSGWATFYTFSSHRGADWGSIWLFFQHMQWPVVGTSSVPQLNLMSLGLFAVACVGIALLALAAPRPPRVAQLVFLTTAAFLLFNKVWSPQYVVWLVPLVVLARPRLPAYLVWQVTEVGYFYAIWAYLITETAGLQMPGAISNTLYFDALLARFCSVLLLCALVVRDCMRPELDVVRTAEVDDPAGGVLSGATDRLTLRLSWRRLPATVSPSSLP